MIKYLRDNRGFTLLETMIAAVVGVVLVGAAYGVYSSQQKGLVEVERQSNRLQSARITMDSLTRMLRQAGYGVATGNVFLDAKQTECTFRGDIDGDIDIVLSEVASVGDTQLSVDLDDEEHQIEITDSIYVFNNSTKELIPVRSVGGPAYDLTGEPDTIYLGQALTNSFPVEGTKILTIETVSIQHDYLNKIVHVNGEVVAKNVNNLGFSYYNESGTQLIPETAESLGLTDRANIRNVGLDVYVKAASHRANQKRQKTKVKLRNMGLNGKQEDITPPASPTGLQITQSDTCGQFTISYSTPTTNSDGTAMEDLAGYKVYYGTESGEYFQPAYPISDEALTEVTIEDTRIVHGQIYYVSMIAYDAKFNESDFASEISFTLNDFEGPDAPVNVDGSVSGASITVSWDPPQEAPDVMGYRIYRGTTSGFNPVTPIIDENELGDDATSFIDVEIDTCRTYYYKVAAVDCVNEGELSDEIFGDGDGPLSDNPVNSATSTTAIEVPPTPPAAPAGVSSNGGNTQIQVNWINPTDSDFAGVTIRWSTSNYPYNVNDGNLLEDVYGNPGEASTIIHDNLPNGQPYYYTLFAFDSCGNYSYAMQTSATPGMQAPVVEIVYPTSGTVISNGHMMYMVQAYDVDEVTLGNPPNLSTDNGKGITSIQFDVDPSPTWTGFPKTEYQAEYCGFGGNTNPCPYGDVSTWCDGTYNLYASATDNEGQSSTSSYVDVIVRNGGLYLDETFVRSTSGTYKQEINFQLQNTASNDITVQGITPQWDRSYARLQSIEVPSGNAVWTAPTGYPNETGNEVYFGYESTLTIPANETRTFKMVFTHFYATLTSSASSESDRLYIDNNAASFEQGQVVYISNAGNSEVSVVSSIGTNYIDLTTPLVNGWPYGTKISQVENDDNSPMSSANVQVQFRYNLDWLSQECGSDEYDVSVIEGPTISYPVQDQPADDTPCSTGVGSVGVVNFRQVPVQVQVTDNSMQGLNNVSVHYKSDSNMGTVAPSSGYSAISMTYNESSDEYQATIPYGSNSRVWFYFTASDNSSQTTREPVSGAYTFDFVEDSDAPACPLGLVATTIALKQIDLSWNHNIESDLRGYNIYRNTNCGSYTRIYTLVTDSDPNNPGVQFTSADNRMNTSKNCYGYYITAVDLDMNESTGCEVYYQSAGDCPCN